jgi:hypothetical protein
MDHPIAAYNAVNDLEAHLICSMLNAAGVEAYTIEDRSQVGTWIGGYLPQIHRAQVWVDRSDIGRAAPILEDYKRRAAERRTLDEAGPPIEVVCEECGTHSSFPANKRGSVQHCPGCGAFVDVGDEEPFDDWGETPDESGEE